MNFQYVPTKDLTPNSWNPNVMSEEDYTKALESVERFGFVDPITVRLISEGAAPFEIIDGENRWRVAIEKGLPEVPVVVLEVDDDTAKQLTIVLNELRGEPDETRLAALIRNLAERRPMAELERVLPYRRQQLASMVAARREAIDWAKVERPVVGVPGQTKARWVERVYRLPADAAAVLDDAIARASEDDGIEAWQALELIAADFLSGR